MCFIYHINKGREGAKADEGRKRLHRALRATVQNPQYNGGPLNYLNLGVPACYISMKGSQSTESVGTCGGRGDKPARGKREEVGWRGRYHRHLQLLEES